MQEDPKGAEHRKRLNLPPGIDPRNYDPRKAIDPAVVERMMRAQAVARAQAQAATTVVVGTIVTLITSALGFVAALSWNDALTIGFSNVLSRFGIQDNTDGTHSATVLLIKAVVVTIFAVVGVVILNRIAGRWAKKTAIAASAGDGSY